MHLLGATTMNELKKIYTHELQVDAMYSSPLFFDDGENMFLPPKKPVTIRHLKLLEKWNLAYVVTTGSLIQTKESNQDIEELEELTELEPLEEEINIAYKIAENIDSQSKEILEMYNYFQKRVTTIYTHIYNRKVPNRKEIIDIAEEINEKIKHHWKEIIIFINSKAGRNLTLAESALYTAFYAGVFAQNSAEQINSVNIIISALLHDVGMIFLPDFITQKKGILSTKEFEYVKQHPLYSMRFAENNLFMPKAISLPILEHHEQYNGEGYPKKLTTEQISSGGKLLALADSFVALISEKNYRDPYNCYEAMKILLLENKTKFYPEFVSAFINLFGMYPLGQLVELSNGSIGQVVEINPHNAFQPQIKILIKNNNEEDNFQQGLVINLLDEKDITIKRPFSPYNSQ